MGSTIGACPAVTSSSQRHRQRVHREVAGDEVALQGRRPEIVEVELHAGASHPGGAALGVEHHGRGPEPRGDALGQGQGAARHREVEVGARPPQHGIAHGAADQHDVAGVATGRGPDRAQESHGGGRQAVEAELGGARGHDDPAQARPKKRSALSWKIFRRTASSRPRCQAHRRSSS